MFSTQAKSLRYREQKDTSSFPGVYPGIIDLGKSWTGGMYWPCIPPSKLYAIYNPKKSLLYYFFQKRDTLMRLPFFASLVLLCFFTGDTLSASITTPFMAPYPFTFNHTLSASATTLFKRFIYHPPSLPLFYPFHIV